MTLIVKINWRMANNEGFLCFINVSNLYVFPSTESLFTIVHSINIILLVLQLELQPNGLGTFYNFAKYNTKLVTVTPTH